MIINNETLILKKVDLFKMNELKYVKLEQKLLFNVNERRVDLFE